MTIAEQLSDLSPAAYAPYRAPREYITSWTDRIWIKRGLGQIHDHYAAEVKVHTCYGETYDLKNVIGNSIQRMVAFPNRGGGHDDVVWESRGNNAFMSAHRVFNNATHSGPWTYGPGHTPLLGEPQHGALPGARQQGGRRMGGARRVRRAARLGNRCAQKISAPAYIAFRNTDQTTLLKTRPQ